MPVARGAESPERPKPGLNERQRGPGGQASLRENGRPLFKIFSRRGRDTQVLVGKGPQNDIQRHCPRLEQRLRWQILHRNTIEMCTPSLGKGHCYHLTCGVSSTRSAQCGGAPSASARKVEVSAHNRPRGRPFCCHCIAIPGRGFKGRRQDAQAGAQGSPHFAAGARSTMSILAVFSSETKKHLVDLRVVCLKHSPNTSLKARQARTPSRNTPDECNSTELQSQDGPKRPRMRPPTMCVHGRATSRNAAGNRIERNLGVNR